MMYFNCFLAGCIVTLIGVRILGRWIDRTVHNAMKDIKL